MIDDERLAALFREAADPASAPPPSFDYHDVVAASRRITARRRAALASGAFVLLAGTAVVGVVGVNPVSHEPAGGSAVSAAEPFSAPEDASEAGPSHERDAVALRDVPGGGCIDQLEPTLTAAVQRALTEIAGATAPAVQAGCGPGGAHQVTLHVNDAGRSGLLIVSHLPPGGALQPPAADSASAIAIRATASGGTVRVHVRSSDGGPAPFADHVDAIAEALAASL